MGELEIRYTWVCTHCCAGWYEVDYSGVVHRRCGRPAERRGAFHVIDLRANRGGA